MSPAGLMKLSRRACWYAWRTKVHATTAITAAIPARTVSHLKLMPDMKSIPPRIAQSTSAVPRSGWSMTRITAGAVSRHAPTIVEMESRRASRALMNRARTMIMRIFASSLNWNCMPITGIVIQRALFPTPVPIASDSTSSPRFSPYSGHAKVLSHL